MLLMAMAVLLALSVASPRALAQIFPPRGDDSMFSMGVFKVVVNPPYRSLLAPSGPLFGYPGYVSADGRLTSPLLFDFNTQVGRSDPYNRPLGGTVDVGVPTMGLQGYGDYPLIPAAWSGAPAGTREILTRIRSLALRSSSQECRNTDPRVPHPPIDYQFVSAGPAQGVAAKTVGMVQERVVNGAAPPDFPARSFFDVFVDFQMAGPQSGSPDCREHTTGTFDGGPTATIGGSWGAIKALYR